MGHSIYLADDEKSIRELLHSFLASDGYTVRSFESGDALLEAFRQEPAELVILDIMMPGTDGLTVCRELRAVSDIPIILLTAKDSELDYVMGISQGSQWCSVGDHQKRRSRKNGILLQWLLHFPTTFTYA